MKKIFILFLIFSGVLIAQNPVQTPAPAQKTEQKPDSTLNIWVPSMVASLNISQISFRDWATGGDNSLTWTLTGDFKASRKGEEWNLSSRLKATYGRTKISNNDFRTNNNELYFEIVASLKLGWAVDPYLSNTLRTQLTQGFNYTVTPYVQIADFFDPGYITQSIGFTFDKLKFAKSRLGLAIQEVFAKTYMSTADASYAASGKTYKSETGIESVSDIEGKLDQNLVLKSSLRLFSRFERFSTWDVRWDNTITAKVNNWLNVNFSYLLVYEEAQIQKTQMKEALQIGIVYTII